MRSFIKRKLCELTISAISDSFYRYVQKHPGCRLYQVSEACLPQPFGSHNRLFASAIMTELVSTNRLHKDTTIKRQPVYYVEGKQPIKVVVGE